MTNAEINELSERELELLKLVATGASNKEIAQKLYISSNTVKVHLRNIFAKIGVTSRTEAAMYAVRNGLVETSSANLLSPDIGAQVTDADALAGESSQPSSVTPNNKQLIVRYLGITGGVLVILVLLGIAYLRGYIFPTHPLLAATSTPRLQWYQLPGPPTPRKGLAVTEFENQVYAIAGEAKGGISNIVEKYDPKANVWTDLPLKPTPVTDVSAAVISGLIYVPGGRSTSGLPVAINEYFDPRKNQWSSAASLPKPLSAYALIVYEGRMYLFGGWDGQKVVNEAYLYDQSTDSWSDLPPMPTAREYAGAVVFGGKIYVIGGWDGQKALSVAEVYQPGEPGSASAWIQASPLPSGRYGMGITNLADIIFIVGGQGPDESLSAIALPPEDPKWGQLEAPLQSGWSFLGAVTVGTRFYALGGATEEGLYDQMWTYQAIFTITLPIVR